MPGKPAEGCGVGAVGSGPAWLMSAIMVFIMPTSCCGGAAGGAVSSAPHPKQNL